MRHLQNSQNSNSRLDASMLCLADRGFNGYEHRRCAANRQLPVIKALPDGSFLSEIRPSKGAARSDASIHSNWSAAYRLAELQRR